MPLTKVFLVITIDVEEDQWGINRFGLTVENVREIIKLQTLFDRYGIKPTYLVSFQVTLYDWAVNVLREIFAEGKCEIGAHLHPWNTPPLKEEINAKNSMLSNLPYELQKEKLTKLTDQIKKSFGTKPESFRAGRWGLGSETIEALIEFGYRVDSSVTPMMSWPEYGKGPEYKGGETEPYWLLAKNNTTNKTGCHSILEVPVSIGYNRWPFDFWENIHVFLENKWLKHFHLIGIFHRTGLLRKIWLSPEQYSANEMIALSKLMIKRERRYLNLTFHSNTLLPKKGPFIMNENELENFYCRIEKYLEYMTSHTNLVSLTLSEVRQLFEGQEENGGRVLIS